MAYFILRYHDIECQLMVIDSEELEPGELDALHRLGKACKTFTFERMTPDRLEPMDHDTLDDIALHNVNVHCSGNIGWQAKQRVTERGLQ